MNTSIQKVFPTTSSEGADTLLHALNFFLIHRRFVLLEFVDTIPRLIKLFLGGLNFLNAFAVLLEANTRTLCNTGEPGATRLHHRQTRLQKRHTLVGFFGCF